MSWTITGAEKTPVDPVFNNVSLLLHGNGANGSTTITDSSSSPKTVTAVGNAQISTVQSKFGGASISLDGAGDRLTCPIINFQTNSFTIETWAFANNTLAGLRAIAGNWRNEQLLLSQDGINLNFSWFPFSAAGSLLTASGIVANQWQHLAVTKEGSSFRLFINGSLVSSATNTQPIPQSTTNFLIGDFPNFAGSPAGSNYNGYLDDFRITLGVARYTSNFTPPTAPFPDI
jgi:hypothetical protein